MKDFVKNYFIQLIKATPPNIVLGDSLKFGIRFMNKNGKWSDTNSITEVNKREL